MADYTYEIVMEKIVEFEKGLDNEHEIGAQLASFGASLEMRVTSIGYANPSTLFFYGIVNGKNATLIQNMNQLNFLLIALPRAEKNSAPRRIGFLHEPQ